MLPHHQEAGECRKLQHFALASYAAPKSAMGREFASESSRIAVIATRPDRDGADDSQHYAYSISFA